MSRRLRRRTVAFDVSSANRLWRAPDLELDHEFATRLERSFQSPAGTVDFAAGTKKAERTINAWVSSTTGGKLDKLLADQLDRDIRLVLTNAVYFRGEWEKPFSEHQTRPAEFHVTPTTESGIAASGT